MRKKFAAAPALLSLALGLSAAFAAARQAGMSAELRSLVEAERAFARASATSGMKEAFLAFAADEGLIFRGAPVNAKETWRRTHPAPTGLLTWRPAYADISRAGDLGYTTGPYEFREKPADEDAAGHGHYVTLWRRQPDGAWKFVLDIGTPHAAPPRGAAGLLAYPPEAQRARAAAGADPEATRRAVLGAERELNAAAAGGGAPKALLAAEDVRFYRPGALPLAGKKSLGEALAGRTEVTSWRPARAEVARSGDLAYVYGTYESGGASAPDRTAGRGSYMRIWKRRQGVDWRVVLDITNPSRPPAQ